MKFKNTLSIIIVILSYCHIVIFFTGCKQKNSGFNHGVHRPKLVVGIVVDQMRWDYLYRYSSKYSQNGFKRLMREGYNCQNTHINYIPTYTGPGHACIYTGSVPAIHGIAANDWWEHDNPKKTRYCVDDALAKPVGVQKSRKVSPRNLLTSTITDELRLATNFQSKVIAVALKDRSAILPGGHSANAAYFFDDKSSNFITSDYYTYNHDTLPKWVDTFNDKGRKAKSYLSKDWDTISRHYIESTADDEPYEDTIQYEHHPVFSHQTSKLVDSIPNIIAYTPYGNTITLDFSRAAIEGENLGNRNETDFLAISLSSTDYIGHKFGPNSVEMEDCYLRLDNDLASFFDYLDEKIGKDNYLLFLTADHGVGHSPGFLQQEGVNIPSGNLYSDMLYTILESALHMQLDKRPADAALRYIDTIMNLQIYLNPEWSMANRIAGRDSILNFTRHVLMQVYGVAGVVDFGKLSITTLQDDLKQKMTNGYFPGRSGDFMILSNPAWLEEFKKGTTHGSPYPYDTHIPLLWYGWNIKHGETHADVHMTDIAPTLAALLHIQEPNGCVGKVIPLR